MKTHLHHLLAALIFYLGLLVPVVVQAQFSFTTNSDAITITGYTGSSATVVIPDMTNGYPVTSIASGAFDGASRVTSVTISTNVSNIGIGAFYTCTSLTNVSIPNSVTVIGGSAFANCSDLTSVTIPFNVSSIGDDAFGGCSSLTSAYFQGNAPPDDGTVFYTDSAATVYYLSGTTGWSSTFGGIPTAVLQPQFGYAANNGVITITGYTGSGGAVVIPAMIGGLPVISIGTGAFIANDTLTNVSIPNSVTTIGQTAFWECFNLTSVTIGTNVTSIGLQAFAYCFNLTNVIIPASVTSFADDAFAHCYDLTSAYFQGNAPPDDGTVFYTDSAATVYYLSGTMGWGSTFGSVPTVEIAPNGSLQVTINPAGAVSTGAQWQVDGGASQYSGTIVANLSVGNHTVSFTTVSGWATPTNEIVSISDNLTSTASGTYVQSSPFTCAINHNNTLTIVGYTGSGGTVVIPATINGYPVTGIGDNAFSSQTSMTNVTIPNSVTNIGSGAFEYCYDLASVILSTNLTSIGDFAFYECFDLVNVTIPSSVTSIGELTFYDCTSLGGIYFQGDAPALGIDPFDLDNTLTVYYLSGTSGWSTTFGGVPAVMSLSQFNYYVNNGAITIYGYNGSGGLPIIPDTLNSLPVTSIGFEAFDGSTGLTSLTIGSNITNIGYYAFAGCTSLTNITVDASNPAYSSLNGVLFDKAQLTLVQVPPGLGGSYVIPDSVTSIGAGLNLCASLTSVSIGTNVTSIEAYTFYGCSSLTNITVDASNPAYSSLNGVLFDKAQLTLIQFPLGLAGSYVIPSSVTSIGFEAFDGSASLASLTIPTSMTSIGDYAFYGCSSLTSAYFQGNAPPDDGTVFYGDNTTVYYLPGATGWSSTFGGVPAVLLNLTKSLLSITFTPAPAVGLTQNLYVSDNNSKIYEITSGGVLTTFASGLNRPDGLAFDSAGNLYEADGGSGNIFEFTNNAGILSTNAITFAAGLSNPTGLAFNSAGNLYAGETIDGSSIVDEIKTNGTQTTLAPVPTVPQSLACDNVGDLYVSDSGANGLTTGSIFEFTNNAGTLSANVITFASSLNYPVGLAFATNGNLFDAEGNGGNIFEFTNNAGTLSASAITFVSGLNHPAGLAFDGTGNLYEADGGSGTIYEFTNNAGTLSSTPIVFASGVASANFIAFGPPTSNTNNKIIAEITVNNGQVGSNYLIQSSANLLNNNWTTLTNVTMSSQSYIYIDNSSATNPQEFYRAVEQ